MPTALASVPRLGRLGGGLGLDLPVTAFSPVLAARGLSYPHHAQAIEMAQMAATKAAGQQTEISQMQTLLQRT